MTGTQKLAEPNFFAAYSGWRHACWDVDDLNLPTAETATKDRALKARSDAAWRMVRIPVRGIYDLQQLAMAVQDLFMEADHEGPPLDGVHRALLDKLIREILSYYGEEVVAKPEPADTPAGGLADRPS